MKKVLPVGGITAFTFGDLMFPMVWHVVMSCMLSWSLRVTEFGAIHGSLGQVFGI